MKLLPLIASLMLAMPIAGCAERSPDPIGHLINLVDEGLNPPPAMHRWRRWHHHAVAKPVVKLPVKASAAVAPKPTATVAKPAVVYAAPVRPCPDAPVGSCQ